MNTPILNGSATAALLAENGITSTEELATQKIGSLAAVKGFSEMRSRRKITGTQALFAAVTTKIDTRTETVPAKDMAKKKANKKK
ncbi:helix-hairpin-helix domain-containing protein [uncultured Desulfuromonas sp.]|uniref:helix-hairpin-helix domain-containing protein n=1 Tax=uncultured Desulfuromonas sp. TaxID=181013 RepID=UPI002AABAA81|nr:helix-hairpin-helix domain-containing protein [uncultured Desulfuromonas sp.]